MEFTIVQKYVKFRNIRCRCSSSVQEVQITISNSFNFEVYRNLSLSFLNLWYSNETLKSFNLRSLETKLLSSIFKASCLKEFPISSLQKEGLLIRAVRSSPDVGNISRIGLTKFHVLFSSVVPLAITTVISFSINWSPNFTMLSLTKLEFLALDINDDNYLSWVLDAEIHLDAMNLGETIKE
uniref:Uncharacterized protein n=1 Tax=Cucumis melo TaxID=3656 RepID=A0A9I9EDQ0_CUCME